MSGEHSYDLTIIGSGFGGSLLAMIARKLGRTVAVVEKQIHPRFAIGESTTPLTNLYLEQLSKRYGLDEVLPLCKWGSWQTKKKELAVGLKRGFSFFYHKSGEPFSSDSLHSNQLLVAASPHNRIADTHWYRSDFDAYLAGCAMGYGADLYENTNLTDISVGDGFISLKSEQGGKPVRLKTRFVVDATGPRGFLFQRLGLLEEKVENMPATAGLYNHFRNVGRMDEIPGMFDGTLPYPVDDAALHHLFDEGWMWMLRFNNGVVSAGLSVKEKYANEIGLSDGEAGWKHFLNRFPTIRDQFAQATPLYDFRYIPKMSFRSKRIAGNRWALLPSAAAFIDPLLSMGFPLTLRGIMRIGRIMEGSNPESDISEPLKRYAADTRKESDLAELMIGGLYACLNDFEVFSALSLIYFAAASYSETAIRLGKSDMSDSFLLSEDPEFGSQMRQCFSMAKRGQDANKRNALLDLIYKTIEPIDVAGLCDHSHRNWYPVRMDDLTQNAHKLSASPEEAAEALKKAGF